MCATLWQLRSFVDGFTSFGARIQQESTQACTRYISWWVIWFLKIERILPERFSIQWSFSTIHLGYTLFVATHKSQQDLFKIGDTHFSSWGWVTCHPAKFLVQCKTSADMRDVQQTSDRHVNLFGAACRYLRELCQDIMKQNMWQPAHWNKIDLFLRTNTIASHLVFRPLQAWLAALPPSSLVLPPPNQPHLFAALE